MLLVYLVNLNEASVAAVELGDLIASQLCCPVNLGNLSLQTQISQRVLEGN